MTNRQSSHGRFDAPQRTVDSGASRVAPLLFLVAGLTIVVQSPAHAACYVDPGSGAVLLQALLAGALGSLFFVKRAYDALRGWFSRKRGDSDKGSQP